MNKREENKFSMYKGVEKVLDESASVITAQAFKDSVTEFKDLLKTISDKDNQYITRRRAIGRAPRTASGRRRSHRGID